jgi:hypothetical protein
VLSNREDIEEILDERLETIREGQVEGAFKQGDSYSKEQETILDFIPHYVQPNFGDNLASHNDYETISDWAEDLHGRLKGVKLGNTDEDRILRETFRDHPEYESFPDWPTTEFLETVEAFLDENIEESTEYQTKLVGESELRAGLVCWGVIGR